MSPEGTSTGTSNYTRDDIRPGAVFTNAQGIRCSVQKTDGNDVYLKVLDGNKIDGKEELHMPFNELKGEHWTLARKAA